MIVDDENHPRMIKAHKELLRRLGVALGDGTSPLTTGFLHDLFEIVEYHRTQCLHKGIKFPALVALCVPKYGIVEFKRADLDIASIRESVVNFVRTHPQCNMTEVVEAFRAAYPDLRPNDILEKREAGTQANERSAERVERLTEEAEKIVREQGDDSPTT